MLEKVLILLIQVYRALGAVLRFLCGGQVCGCCRFTPTCSEYAKEAISKHGAWRGILLTVRRIFRCHPWNTKWGYDPVPVKVETEEGECRG